MINLYSEIELDSLSPEEITIILNGITGSSLTTPTEPNVVWYGEDIKVLFKSKEKSILSIHVENRFWKKNKERIISYFNSSITPSHEKIQSQVVFSYGKELSIPPFKWKDEFQLGRPPEGNPKSQELLSLHPCLFQFKTPITGKIMLDSHRIQEGFRKRFLPLIPLLRHCSKDSVQFNLNSKKAWALTGNEDEFSSEWLQSGYMFESIFSSVDYFPYNKPSSKIIPSSEIDPCWPSGSTLSLGYSSYESLSEEKKDKFLLGCEWFNKAVTAHDPTDQFLFMIIMLEIFIPKESTNCEKCKQSIYGINKKFKTYIPEVIGNDWAEDFESVLNKLYTLRSNIAHNGVAVAQHSAGIIPIKMREESQLRYLFDLGRQFLVSWLERDRVGLSVKE